MKNKKLKEIIKNARHPASTLVTAFAIVITVAFYAGLTYCLVFASNDPSLIEKITKYIKVKTRLLELLVRIGGPAIFIVIVGFVVKLIFADAKYLGKASANSVHLSVTDFEEVKELYKGLLDKMGLESGPAVYLGSDDNVPSYLGIDICSKRAIKLVLKDVKKAYKGGDYKRIEYMLAEKLARIYLGNYYIPVIVFTFAARQIPYFNSFYERIGCYSVDGFVRELLGKDRVIEHIFEENFDDELYGDESINDSAEKVIQIKDKFERLGRFCGNIDSKEPIPAYRLDAILNDKPGRIF